MSTDEKPSDPRIANLKPWKKGQSGNPHGRRAKGLATAERLRTALVKDLPDILKALVTKAKGGDMRAIDAILERVLPPLKAIEGPTLLEPLTGTLTEQGRSLLEAMSRGAITPGQTAQLLAALAAQAKVVEVDDLARRIQALEAKASSTRLAPPVRAA